MENDNDDLTVTEKYIALTSAAKTLQVVLRMFDTVMDDPIGQEDAPIWMTADVIKDAVGRFYASIKNRQSDMIKEMNR